MVHNTLVFSTILIGVLFLLTAATLGFINELISRDKRFRTIRLSDQDIEALRRSSKQIRKS